MKGPPRPRAWGRQHDDRHHTAGRVFVHRLGGDAEVRGRLRDCEQARGHRLHAVADLDHARGVAGLSGLARGLALCGCALGQNPNRRLLAALWALQPNPVKRGIGTRIHTHFDGSKSVEKRREQRVNDR